MCVLPATMQRVLPWCDVCGLQPCSVFCPAGGYMAGQMPRPLLEDDFDPLDYDGSADAEKAKKAMKAEKAKAKQLKAKIMKAQKAAKKK